MTDYKLRSGNPFCGIGLAARTLKLRGTGEAVRGGTGLEKVHHLYGAEEAVRKGDFPERKQSGDFADQPGGLYERPKPAVCGGKL